jgi:hypothetical protein
MGVVNFSVEWLDNKEEIHKLYEALCVDRRSRLKVVAQSPTKYCVIDGNIDMSMVGKERLKKYYIPQIEEAHELLSAKGIVTALHLDGRNHTLLEPVSHLAVPVIESFTPPPDCDVSVDEGLRVWPDKALIVNFPSSLHLMKEKDVFDAAELMLEQARDSGRVIMGVIESVPNNDNIIKLAKVVAKFGLKIKQ